jgi:RNA recognition motif-containing protein
MQNPGLVLKPKKKKSKDGDLSTRPKLKETANISDLVPAGLCSTTVPDSPNKLFCGAIPTSLTEEQVKELFCSFGALKGFNMVRDKAKGDVLFFLSTLVKKKKRLLCVFRVH